MKTLKAISLFAGAGGCSLGFKTAGFEIISAYELNDCAIKTYNLNFGEDKCHKADLSACDFEKIRDDLNLKRGEIDLILGGPPCQGFTTAGSRFWDDPRNKLVRNYIEAIDKFYPRWFMFENVEGILTTAKGSYLVELIKALGSIGYTVFLKKIYMQEYGIPQRRKRVIIVGNREGKNFEFPSPVEVAKGSIYKNTSFTLKNAIYDLQDKEDISIDHIFTKPTGIQFERIRSLKPGQSMKDLPASLQNKSFKKRSSRRVCDGTPSERRGGPPSGLKRLVYDEPSLTITSSSCSEFIHPIMDRPITIRECARIQTFPDNFTFLGTNAQKKLQIGNAIPPKFANLLANEIIEYDSSKPEELSPGLAYYSVTKSDGMSPSLKRTSEELDKLIYENKLNKYSRINRAGGHSS